jgi:hypothetical protein
MGDFRFLCRTGSLKAVYDGYTVGWYIIHEQWFLLFLLIYNGGLRVKRKMLARCVAVLMVCVMAIGLTLTCAMAADDYSFTLHNNTKVTITKILVSQDKNEWGEFDIGSGIKAGETSTLSWDQSTNNEECKQWVKAVFSDKTESPPSKIDFCEKGLALEF